MKYWQIILVFLVGSALAIVGALFKIQHWAGANWLLNISMLLQVVAVVLMIVKLVKNRKTNGLDK